jgi:nucleotide-binding universal stress UspA family protein
MKQILVPTDFSKCAHDALEYALELAKASGAGLHLLHVVYPNEGLDNNVYNILMDPYLDARKHNLDNLVEKVRKNPAHAAIPIQSEVTIGFPATTASEYVENHQIDLVVMGTTGATGLQGYIFGSTTGNLASKLNVPLLAIPPGTKFGTIERMAFATDFNLDLSDKTMDVLNGLLRIFKAQLNVVHIFDQPDDKLSKRQEDHLSRKLGDIQHDFRYIHNMDVAQALNDYLEATESGGLVVVAHKHGFWSQLFGYSVSRNMVQHAHLPILVLHDRL